MKSIFVYLLLISCFLLIHENSYADAVIRPLSKLASGSQVLGAHGTEKPVVVLNIHEDLSTGVTTQLAAEVEFRKRSIERIVGNETGLPLPRFVTLKSHKTNLRQGPGKKYATNWLYETKSYPMLVVAEFENWRKLKDFDGQEGWVNEKLITGKRNVLLINSYRESEQENHKMVPIILYRYPDEKSFPLARLEPKVLGEVSKCSIDWCKIKVKSYRGWVHKVNVWGVLRDEVIN